MTPSREATTKKKRNGWKNRIPVEIAHFVSIPWAQVSCFYRANTLSVQVRILIVLVDVFFFFARIRIWYIWSALPRSRLSSRFLFFYFSRSINSNAGQDRSSFCTGKFLWLFLLGRHHDIENARDRFFFHLFTLLALPIWCGRKFVFKLVAGEDETVLRC